MSALPSERKYSTATSLAKTTTSMKKGGGGRAKHLGCRPRTQDETSGRCGLSLTDLEWYVSFLPYQCSSNRRLRSRLPKPTSHQRWREGHIFELLFFGLFSFGQKQVRPKRLMISRYHNQPQSSIIDMDPCIPVNVAKTEHVPRLWPASKQRGIAPSALWRRGGG